MSSTIFVMLYRFEIVFKRLFMIKYTKQLMYPGFTTNALTSQDPTL